MEANGGQSVCRGRRRAVHLSDTRLFLALETALSYAPHGGRPALTPVPPALLPSR